MHVSIRNVSVDLGISVEDHGNNPQHTMSVTPCDTGFALQEDAHRAGLLCFPCVSLASGGVAGNGWLFDEFLFIF